MAIGSVMLYSSEGHTGGILSVGGHTKVVMFVRCGVREGQCQVV